MFANNELLFEQCRKLLKQAAWRLQYHARVQQLRELPTSSEFNEATFNFDEKVVSDIFVQELIKTIKNVKCRYIIEKIATEGMTEKDLAIQLGISKQGVNKWKRKAMDIIKYNWIHSNVH